MRFGGHQTFSIREGWLYKGLRVLNEEPDAFGTDTLQDRLGVGKNMARAIHHWLIATGLARPSGGGRGRRSDLEITELGELVWHFDPYFLEPGTWWLVHAELVNNRKDALSWNWFFNRFTATRFERGVVIEGLRRFLQTQDGRTPTIRTLERDVACLLKSYAEVIPREDHDPEDILECPLTRLGLLTFSRHSGFYHLNTDPKDVPFPVFGYVVSRAYTSSDDQDVVDISLTELARRENGPGRLFALSTESLFEMLLRYQEGGEKRVTISSQAGERVIRFENQPGEDWLQEYLSSIQSEPIRAAS